MELDKTVVQTVATETLTAKNVISELSHRERSRARLDLRKLKHEVRAKGRRVDDSEYIRFFKGLEKAGAGKLTANKWVWRHKLRDVVKVALDAPTPEKRIERKTTGTNPAPIQITFNLPAGTRMEDLFALMSLAKDLEGGL